MQKVGIIGEKYSDLYISVINSLNDVDLMGVFDPSFQFKSSNKIDSKLIYYSFEDLINNIDSVVFASEEQIYFPLIEMAIKYSKSVFIYSVRNLSREELLQLLKIKEEANVIVQIYHPLIFDSIMEEYNLQNTGKPILLTYDYSNHSESNVLHKTRLIISNVLSLFKSDLRKITINIISVFSELPDIIKVRIDFDNGSMAEIMINTIEREHKHIIKSYEYNCYFQIDLIKKLLTRKLDNEELVSHSKNRYDKFDILKNQLIDFYSNINKQKNPINDIFNELKTQRVLDELKNKLKINIGIY
jgi:hypothetical protein